MGGSALGRGPGQGADTLKFRNAVSGGFTEKRHAHLDGGRGFHGVWGVRGNGERCSGFGVRQIGVKILTPRFHSLMMLGKRLHHTDKSFHLQTKITMLNASLSLI